MSSDDGHGGVADTVPVSSAVVSLLGIAATALGLEQLSWSLPAGVRELPLPIAVGSPPPPQKQPTLSTGADSGIAAPPPPAHSFLAAHSMRRSAIWVALWRRLRASPRRTTWWWARPRLWKTSCRAGAHSPLSAPAHPSPCRSGTCSDAGLFIFHVSILPARILCRFAVSHSVRPDCQMHLHCPGLCLSAGLSSSSWSRSSTPARRPLAATQGPSPTAATATAAPSTSPCERRRPCLRKWHLLSRRSSRWHSMLTKELPLGTPHAISTCPSRTARTATL